VIRFDLQLSSKFPPEKPHEMWLDHAIVHETCTTYAEDTLKYLLADIVDSPGRSPAFQKTFGAEVRRYGCLLDVVKRLSEERKLGFRPTFLVLLSRP
jgi:hypothetical protein